MNRSAEVEKFYQSWEWRRRKKKYAESVGNLCERCRKRGKIEAGSKDRPLEVHHKIPLNEKNIHNAEIAFGWDNLELLCKTCHDQERKLKEKRWKIGPDGKVIL